MLRESGRVLKFNVIDESRFVIAALALPGARHFAATDDCEPAQWPDGLHQAHETPNINRVEARGGHTVAFRLDDGSREGVRTLVLGEAPEDHWNIWHWWIYSDEAVLISCYDWSYGPCIAHLSLSEWAETLQRDDVIELTGFTEYTDEWFETVEREDQRWRDE